MKAQVITQQPLTLDFDAHQFEFLQGGRELNTVWEKLIENTPARAVIRWVDEKLYLFALPSAMVEITRSGLSEIMPLRNPVFQYYPAFRSEPLAVSEEGNIYRSYPGAESHLMWRSNLPANRLSPLGLSPGSILLLSTQADFTELKEGSDQWTLETIDTVEKQVIWTKNEFLYSCLPAPDGIFMVTDNDRRVLRLVHHKTGVPIWQTRVPAPILELIAIVNDGVWLTDEQGTIMGINRSTGKAIASLKLPTHRHPEGVVDGSGRFILCNGLNVAILDLTLSEKSLILAQGSIGIASGPDCSTVSGKRVLLTTDNAMIFPDYYNRVYRVPLEDPRSGVLLWEAPSSIRNLGVASDYLVVLHGSFLTCLSR